MTIALAAVHCAGGKFAPCQMGRFYAGVPDRIILR